MKAKSIVTLVLLAFVVVSVVYLVVSEMRAPTGGGEGAGADPSTAAGAGTADAGAPGRQLIVYYFHGNKRCQTCRTIEAFTDEAITTGFEDDLESGRVVWKTVNVDEPANGHFIKDFKLTTRSVVLVDTRGGEQQGWTNLERVWDLVGTKDEFIDYITENTNAYLVESDG